MRDLALFVVLVPPFQITGLYVSILLSLSLKTVVAWWLNHRRIVPLRLSAWQSFGAPVLAGLTLWLALHALAWSLGPVGSIGAQALFYAGAATATTKSRPPHPARSSSPWARCRCSACRDGCPRPRNSVVVGQAFLPVGDAIPHGAGSLTRSCPDHINVNEDYEVDYWCTKFGCTPEQVRAVVKAVGVMDDDVERQLKGR